MFALGMPGMCKICHLGPQKSQTDKQPIEISVQICEWLKNIYNLLYIQLIYKNIVRPNKTKTQRQGFYHAWNVHQTSLINQVSLCILCVGGWWKYEDLWFLWLPLYDTLVFCSTILNLLKAILLLGQSCQHVPWRIVG